MKRAMIFFLIGVLLVGCSPATPAPTNTPAAPITHIYAFGDDFSDNGNELKIIKDRANKGDADAAGMLDYFTNYMWEGRMSNGPVLTEVLADRLKAALTSYAVGGALSGNDNYDLGKNYGLLWQVDQFKSEGNKVDPGSLFTMEIGIYDLGKVIYHDKGDISDQAITNLADAALSNMRTAITQLAEAGAKQFLVGTPVDWSNVPAFDLTQNTRQVKVYQDRLVTQLPAAMDELAKQLGVKIKIFDFIAASQHIRDNASQYGLTHLTDFCSVYGPPKKVCANPDEYYYFANNALSRRVHQLLGEAMADQISK